MTTIARDALVDEVHEQVARVAARLNRAHADLVELTGRLIDEETWGDGYRSPEHWLVVQAGLSSSTAKDVVRIARRRDEIPATVQRLGDARLSLAQAAVVARKAPTRHQQSVAETAEHLTVPQLDRLLRRYVFEVPDAATDTTDGHLEPQTSDQKAAAPPTLSMTYDDDGRFRLRYTGSAETGALIEQAVREAKDALFTAGNTEATHADALAEIAGRSLAGAPSGRKDRYRVYVHLDADGAWVNGAGAIPPSLAAKFACDGVAQPIWIRDGIPVSVGRAQRIVPDRTRRLIEDRDRGCRFPGCSATRFVEVHHVDPWSEGGMTDYETNVSLCPHHHDELHRGTYTVSGDPTRPDGLVFRHRRGLVIAPRRPPDDVPTQHDGPVAGQSRYRPPTGERLDHLWVEFQPDLTPEN